MRILAAFCALAVLVACNNESAPTGGSGGSGGSGVGGGGAPPVELHDVKWVALPTDGAPSARYFHTAVWTGSKMIVWGGLTGSPAKTTNDGAIYDPATHAWKPTSIVGAPEGRHSHTAVWTGSRMMVWGGYGTANQVSAGALYDPETDTWKAASSAGEPTPRMFHSVVWTGTKMIVWGGTSQGLVQGNGAFYDPAADAWSPVATSGAPQGRFSHAAVWIANEMILWGGTDTLDWLNGGAKLDASNAWTGQTSLEGAPSGRQDAVAVVAGVRMLIWGGWKGGPYEGTGAIFDPTSSASGVWLPMTAEGAPAARSRTVGFWTGTDLFVWGGCGEDLCGKAFADGGRFVPNEGWKPIAEQAALSARSSHTGVLAGKSIIVWGGKDGSGAALGTGAETPL